MSQTATLLIVDDCPEDRETYRRYLAEDTCQLYDVLMADSAEEGLALVAQQRIDLVLLDLKLPDMDGLDFLMHLQSHSVVPPVIMLTAYGDEEIAVQAMKQGAQDYLAKRHLRADVLQRSVRYGIEQYTLRCQLERTRERQRLMATMALRIRQSLDLEQMLDTAVTEVRAFLRCDRVFLYQFYPDGSGIITAESTAPGCDAFQGQALDAQALQEFLGKQSRPTVAHPSSMATGTAQQLQGSPTAIGLATQDRMAQPVNLTVPIVIGGATDSVQQPWGLLVAHQWTSPRHWLSDEVEILNDLSVQLAIAIYQAELFTQTQASLKREKDLSAFKSKIITTVSHEYRTPLTSILAAASLLKKQGQQLSAHKQQQFLELIEDKAWHMNKLVDDMLVVNNFELGEAKFQPFPLNLHHFFRDLIDNQQDVNPTQHPIEIQISGDMSHFWGDQRLLRQTFTNLLSNAIKYSPAGGRIDIQITGHSEQVIIDIQDQGIGIPAQEQTHLFQSFRRGSNVDTIPGTGLGLMIAKTSTELHGGQIRVSSTEGEGTTVTVCLPKHNTPVTFDIPKTLKV